MTPTRRSGAQGDRGPRTTVPPFLLECLDAIYRLEQEQTVPTVAQVSRRLALGKAEATERVLGLQGLGLVRAEANGRLAVTPEGARRAVGLVRKHRLLERFLSDLLKLPWEQVHEDASRLTPVLSDAATEGLAHLLDHPADCPHGNPIPAADGTLAADTGVPLHELKQGQAGVIVRVEREEADMLRYLATLGLLPQTRLEVEKIAPFGGPVLVRVGTSRYALGRKVASRIFVREV